MGELLNSSKGETTESRHLSYTCPKNMLGECEPPKKKEKKTKKKIAKSEEIEDIAESEYEGEDPTLDSVSQAIVSQEAKTEEQNKRKPREGGPSTSGDSQRQRMKSSTPFSDEEGFSD
ncbi:Zinc finger CCHC-type and RNA-binding motif-containing protein 1 [Fukomys damarensis]|uniref:Zinc finger CCHC-type and RNA-binding motif-containing protein 1 n=1 Tax=Fukomys damarensis TaxID=885580 RepID=A0A091DWV5_FUKDA|nr:Zinc finger CCHC-type and RNA-binding motif-containing protein 1 [Fukomys damarensis]